MKKLLFTLAVLPLAACNSGPSKADAEEIMKRTRPLAETKVSDLRCTEQDNESYNCFIAFRMTTPDSKYFRGGTTDSTLDDVTFRQVDGRWTTNLFAVQSDQYSRALRGE
jgi:hypothetical protein